jgi:TrmH family RNA methyltransferase
MTLAVVFVEPESAGNVGFLARAMANFGLSELVLVNPRELGLMARSRAMHAWPIIQNARVAKSFDEAVAPYDEVIGTTAKTPSDNNSTRAFVTPRELASQLGHGRYCLVIGRESRGLTTEELRKCDITVRITTSDSYPSMNASHAAAVLFYELFSAKENPSRVSDAREKRALLKMFDGIASSCGLRNAENAVKCFRNVVSRAFISGHEAKAIAAVLSRCKKQ